MPALHESSRSINGIADASLISCRQNLHTLQKSDSFGTQSTLGYHAPFS